MAQIANISRENSKMSAERELINSTVLGEVHFWRQIPPALACLIQSSSCHCSAKLIF